MVQIKKQQFIMIGVVILIIVLNFILQNVFPDKVEKLLAKYINKNYITKSSLLMLLLFISKYSIEGAIIFALIYIFIEEKIIDYELKQKIEETAE